MLSTLTMTSLPCLLLLHLSLGARVDVQMTDTAEESYVSSHPIPDSISGTRLITEIQSRRELATDDSGCQIHVDETLHEDVKDFLPADGACTLVVEAPSAINTDALGMLNNQLPLDSLGVRPSAHQSPGAIGYPTTPEHVQELLALAKMVGWQVYIIGGGHSSEAWGFDHGLIISMIHRRGVDVLDDASSMDWSGKALHMESGVVWAEAYAAADEAGEVLLGGSCATVGVVGYYMGGGFGYLSGSLGLGSDNVLRFQVVTASGEVKIVDHNHDADLFNALRGGGQAGFVAVTDVWVKLHQRNKFGCLFKIELDYGDNMDTISWVNKLVLLEPRALHVKPRFAYNSQNGPSHKVALILFTDPRHNTRKNSAAFLAELLSNAGAPLPLGEACQGDWMTCLLGLPGKPTGLASCHKGEPEYEFGPSAEVLIPQTNGGEDSEWGETKSATRLVPEPSLEEEDPEDGLVKHVHGVVASERGLNQESLYSKGYSHRTSTKTLLLTQLTPEIMQSAWDALTGESEQSARAHGLPSVYISCVWWGGGAYGGGDGAVGDAHRPFSWLIIISTDFSSKAHDQHALLWTTATTKAVLASSGEPFRPHPNLYDRLHALSSEHDGPVALFESDPWFLWAGKTPLVAQAKSKWDPDNLFHSPHAGNPENDAEGRPMQVESPFSDEMEQCQLLKAAGGTC